VIRLRPRRDAREVVDRGALEQVLRAVFGQRRKQLGNTLKVLMPLDSWRTSGIDIDFTARAESVTLALFVSLARALVRRPDE
jgi:16S rRNA (adenine1518-N6/adenine1519-N6)-dimethyltransferase